MAEQMLSVTQSKVKPEYCDMKAKEVTNTPCCRSKTLVRMQENRFTPAIIWMLLILYSV